MYPRTAVHSIGFQDAPLRDNSFDLAISNVPFGDFPVVDRAYLKAGERFLTHSVHNYFFHQNAGQTPSGRSPRLASLRATHSMRQRQSQSAPTLHQQADLVDAIRLPAGTFSDTEVVTDLVLLLGILQVTTVVREARTQPRCGRNKESRRQRAPAILDPQISTSQTVRVPALFAVRDAARAALRAQLDGATPQVIQESQRRLNSAYDQFVFRYGPLNAHANVATMGINPDAFFLRALERWDTESQQRHKTGRPVTEASARQRLKMPLFHEIVVRQARPARSARSVRDAYLITLKECGGLNFGRMAALLGPGSSASPDCNTARRLGRLDNVRPGLALERCGEHSADQRRNDRARDRYK
jgi:hypothetical protein